MRYLPIVALLACGTSEKAPTKGAPEVLPAGPVPVALAKVEPAQLRAITKTKAFMWIDAKGGLHLGNDLTGPKPYEGEPIDRQVSPFSLVEEGRALYRRSSSALEYDVDTYAVLTHDPTAHILLMADAAAPAWVTMRHGIEAFHYRAIALAAGAAANTALLYQFGEGPWGAEQGELVLRADHIAELGDKHPASVMLQLTDATTTGDLYGALAALGKANVQTVRLHRMMGWGDIPPSDIAHAKMSTADDDIVVEGGQPTKVTVREPTIDGKVEKELLQLALESYEPRFRFCYEKAGGTKPIELALAFDIAADGVISNAVANAVDKAIASCAAGAIFDLDIPGKGLKGAAHATVKIAIAREAPIVATKDTKPPSGFWCFKHPDGSLGICGRYQEQCESALHGYNETAASLGGEPIEKCVHQASAWQPASPENPDRASPTKAICGKGCRQVR